MVIIGDVRAGKHLAVDCRDVVIDERDHVHILLAEAHLRTQPLEYGIRDRLVVIGFGRIEQAEIGFAVVDRLLQRRRQGVDVGRLLGVAVEPAAVVAFGCREWHCMSSISINRRKVVA